ncbi:LLM class F420-dependent oxidoreductase [Nocardioides silvaticus]|uniref:LLM class F420-dependent oxidoreductase n=1 Tax=Nocardioides silvaticus TaxID=2201891 RepID=A0A316TNW7_9ACTN|nr:LLM class F420-dependent oxidoreductase [Nocardioides silvaticus]PWN03942.1 LLM class F420-dependent oxidoreductase [Nocardioides silvaticus]
MELGVHYANFSHPGWEEHLTDKLVATAQAAEAGGAELFTVMDHWFQMENMGGPAEPMLEAYLSLAHVAAVTDRIRLSALVTGATYRHPGLLAKTVTTLDRLSGGRALLGIGAGWYEREHVGLGVPFPSTSERFERLEETLQICRQLWSDDDGPYDGAHFQLAETICVPPPLAQPHPPIMIGGAGEKKTLRFVAQYAQWCNIFGSSPEVMEHKLGVLRGHCEAVGTDYDAIRKTMIFEATDPLADVDGFVATMGEYAALGIELVTLMPQGEDPVAWTERMCAEVLPRLRAL